MRQAVVTSFNQRTMIYEVVYSLCSQTIRPKRIILVDDGSTDQVSLQILNEIEAGCNFPIPILVISQSNRGVSSARNAGIREAQASFVLVLDEDDKQETFFVEEVSKSLYGNPSIIAASSYLRTFGVLETVVRPIGEAMLPHSFR